MDWIWLAFSGAFLVYFFLHRKSKKRAKYFMTAEPELKNEPKHDRPLKLEKHDPEITISINNKMLISDNTKRNINKNHVTDKNQPDLFEGILLEPIDTRLYDLRPLIGQVEIEGIMTPAIFQETGQKAIFYMVDLADQSCTCRHHDKKSAAPKNDIRRFCEHLMIEFKKRNIFENTNHRTLMVGELGTNGATSRAYALKHDDLPLIYLLIEDESPWVNVYCRQKERGETIHNASGCYVRHGYNIIEKRWSYGMGTSGVSVVGSFFKSISTLEDFDQICGAIAERPTETNLSEQADPRLNPNYNSDQYGPESDNYEIPESSLQSEHPCEFSLLFSYVDGRGGKSRRTVDFKKMQNYGSEGSYLYGECRMRKAGRTFDVKKMANVVDVTTGEVIGDVRRYAEEFWQQSAKAKLSDWADENERIANALLFLLKGNKRPSKSDYLVLAAILSRVIDGERVTTSDVQFLYQEKYPTTAVGFQRLVGGIVKHHSDQVSWFKESAIKLANARAKPNFADLAAIEYLNKRIP